MTTPPPEPPDPADPSHWASPDQRRRRRRRPASSRIPVANVIAGLALYIAINVPVYIATYPTNVASAAAHTKLVIGMVALAVIAFVGGGAMLAVGNPATKGIGLGLMIGWALTSVVSFGYCTGLNPSLWWSY